jgi:spore coat polysaccharide biosynthesis predicted glycosyltransferase SpsG
MRLSALIELLFNPHSQPSRVLFRVDAGRRPGLSFGHLERCHILAQGLRAVWRPQINFLMENIPEGVNRAKALGEEVILLFPDAFSRLAHEFDAVVFDLPFGPSIQDLSTARRAGLWSVILDDTMREISWANVILNSSILARPDPYPDTARLLLGPENLILPDEFCAPKDNFGPRNRKPMVLITFGGSDPTGLTAGALSAITKHKWPRVSFKVITGPGFKEPDRIEKLAQTTGSFVEVIHSPQDLLPYMKQADLAVCAGGRTLYELNALNVPTIAVASIEHEVEPVKAFKNRGLIEAGLEVFEEKTFIKALNHSLERL